MKKLFATALFSGAALAVGAVAAVPDPVATIVVTGHPMTEQTGGPVDVSVSIPDLDIPAGQSIFKIGLQVPGMAHAQTVTNVRITDDEGVVPLVAGKGSDAAEDWGVGEGGDWRSSRRVHGVVTATYRLPLENIEILSGAPPIMMRIDGDGFSGQGSGLVALPPGVTRPYRIKLHWDLKDMGAGAEGVSSYGDGDLSLPAGPLTRIDDSVFMAGHVQRYSPRPGAAFSAVWLGQPTFDPIVAMTWTAKMHAWMSRHFRDEAEPPYRVFLRYNPMNAGGGAALTHSFIFTYKPGVTAESIKSILGHEMTHTWTADRNMGKWYDEGDAVYYQALLPWRAGLISTDAYLKDVNETASRYYTNPFNTVPDDQILDRFWGETFVRVLPYDRGALYFAVLNGKIRRASHGKRSIDDLVQTLVDRRKRGLETSPAVWLDLLKQEIGGEAEKVHAAMLAGGLMLPEDDDYGPCFHRVVRKIRRFDLGFDNSSVLGADKIIKGLKPGSEAEQAGVREGDHFTYGASLDATQGDVNQTLTLKVVRDGKIVPITYLPRGEAVDAYQWERVPGVPETACRG
jgi:hypothetical protein